MKTTLMAWLAGALVLVLAAAAAVSAEAGPATSCFSDWSAAASVVDEEKLVTVEHLSRQFQRQKLGEIVKTELCREPSGYVYRLVVRTPNGRFKTTLYDTRRGIEIGVAETGR